MSKLTRGAEGDPVPTVDPQDLSLAFSIGNEAAAFRPRVSSPEQPGPTRLDGGAEQPIGFTSRPMARFLSAIKEQFGDDNEGYMALGLRAMTLLDVLLRPEVQPWIREDEEFDGETSLHVERAVFQVAATLPLRNTETFDLDAFVARLQEVAPRSRPAS